MSRLAYEEFRIEVDGEEIILRPTLRAASLILTRHDLTSLFRSLLETNVGTIADLIRVGSGQRLPHLHYALVANLHDLHERGPIVETLKAYLVALVNVGADDENAKRTKPTKRSKSKPNDLKPDEFIGTLFAMGSGVLGWSPEQTWSATPSEIAAAHDARISLIGDFLKVVVGGGDDKPIEGEDRLNMTFDRDGYDALKMMNGVR